MPTTYPANARTMLTRNDGAMLGRMAHFILEYQYADLDARARTRDAHLAYLRELADAGRLVMAGPLADDTGAVVVFSADTADEVNQMVDADPYTAARVGSGHTIREWRVVVS